MSRRNRYDYFQGVFSDQIPKNVDRIYAKTERAVRQALRESYNDVTRRLEEFFNKWALPDGTIPSNKVYAYNRLANLENEIAKSLKSAGAKVNRHTRSAIKDTFTETTLKSFEAYNELGFGMTFGVPEKVPEANIFNPMDRIKWTERSQDAIAGHVKRIKSEINKGIIQGFHYHKIARAIREIGEKNFNDVKRIVRTETHRAQCSAINYSVERAKKVAEEVGVYTAKKWIAHIDDRTRDDHIDLDGQISDEEGLFHIGDYSAEFPGGFGVAEQDINCRCSVGLVLVDRNRNELTEDDISEKID